MVKTLLAASLMLLSLLSTKAIAAEVSNTNALRGFSTKAYPTGVWRVTDGIANAPPLFYVPDTGNLCTSDDGATCVAAAKGGAKDEPNFWVAVFNGGTADIREWGIVQDNATDNSSQLQIAMAWAAKTGVALYIPGGGTPFYAKNGILVNTANSGQFIVGGPGAIRFAATVSTGMQVNVGCQFSTIHFSDFTVMTSGASDSSIGIMLHQACASIPDPANTPKSDITNVTLRGADGYRQTDYWGYGIKDDYVSVVDFVNYNYFGSSGLNGRALYLAGGADAGQIGVVYKIKSANFDGFNVGIEYGSYIQGVTVSDNSNFTTCHYGIVTDNSAGSGQLYVSDSQFACDTQDIANYGGVPWMNIHNNLFIPQDNGQAGRVFIYDPLGWQTIIANNIIDGAMAGSEANLSAIGITGGASYSEALITGNLIEGIGTGINLAGSTTQNVKVSGNQFLFVTQPYVTGNNSDSNGNNVTGVGSFLSAVTGIDCSGGSPNLVRVALSTTAGLGSGQWVSITGANYTGFVNATLPVAVVDSTHIDLVGLTCSSSFNTYSGGGLVSSLP